MNLSYILRRMPHQKYARPEPYKSKAKPYCWLSQWRHYVTVDGKEKAIHRGPIRLGLCSVTSKADAQATLNALIAADGSKYETPRTGERRAPAASGTVAAELESYLNLNASQWEPETLQTHRSVVSRQINPALGSLRLREVTREHLQGFLNELSQSKSHSTVKKARNLLAGMFADAIEDEKLSRNPMRKVRMPKTRKPSSRYLTESECSALLAAAHGRDRLIIRLCMVLGFRPGEVFALRRDDIEPGRIRVDEASREGKLKAPKTAASSAYVSLPQSLELELRHWLETTFEDPAGLVFPSEIPGVSLRTNNFRKRNLQEIAAKAGLSGITFQSLRRTTATHSQHLGSVKDVQAMLRHANPDTTARVYMQAIDDSVKRAVEKLDHKLGGKVQ